MRGAVRSFFFGIAVLLADALSAIHAATLPIIDTTKRDQLEDANHAPGVGDVGVGPGEAVSSFNGNLQVTHASSPALPHDGGLSLALTRTYNSKNVRKYRVRYGETDYRELVAGRGPFGFGWTSHVGRIIKRSRYTEDVGAGEWDYDLHDKFFEFPDGSLHRFVPTVKDAHPNLKFQYFQACINGQPENPPPPPPPWCQKYGDAPICNPINECEGRPWNDPRHYDVTFPNGTLYRLEEIVPWVTDPGQDWIKNHDRAGFYTTRITDVHGNAIEIEYWGGDHYPEAIKKIRAVRPVGQPTTEITTEICASTSPECPELGLVREVKATGFQGLRGVPQQTIYTFQYQTVQVTDDDGVQTLPVLHQVALTGSDGSAGGTITYEYGVGRSLGQTVTTHGPLLDRITYPLGAISEYHYGVWNSGSRKEGQTTVARPIVGVTRQTTYTEGLNPNQSIIGKPHYSWTWTRDFASTDCVAAGGVGGAVVGGAVGNYFFGAHSQ